MCHRRYILYHKSISITQKQTSYSYHLFLRSMTFGVVTFHGHPLNEFSMDICTMLILGFFLFIFFQVQKMFNSNGLQLYKVPFVDNFMNLVWIFHIVFIFFIHLFLRFSKCSTAMGSSSTEYARMSPRFRIPDNIRSSFNQTTN